MTEVEYRLKVPIGTKIRYTPNPDDVSRNARKDIGKEGTIVSHCGHRVRILLPTSTKWGGVWLTSWENITLVLTGEGQLLFSFMYSME